MPRVKGMTHPFDKVVGKRIKELRTAARLKQRDIAEYIDVQHQQFQKYETGANRVSSSRLLGICEALDISMTDFFKGIEEEGRTPYHSKNSRPTSIKKGKSRKKKPRRKTIKSNGPDPVDIRVGKNVKRYRLLRKMTQRGLADKIGVGFQQVNKYETGVVRLSSSRLAKICKALSCRIEDLFGK